MAALRKLFQFRGWRGGTGVIPNALCLFFLIGLAPIRDPQIPEYYPLCFQSQSQLLLLKIQPGAVVEHVPSNERCRFGPLLRNGSLREGAGA